MKKLVPMLMAAALFAGCATDDPMMTGKPQDWQGKPAADLRGAWGEPTKIVKKEDGGEMWEYTEGGGFQSSGKNTASAQTTVTGSDAGNTVKRDRLGSYQKIYRFSIKNGKIKSWYAARIEDGRVVWEDH